MGIDKKNDEESSRWKVDSETRKRDWRAEKSRRFAKNRGSHTAHARSHKPNGQMDEQYPKKKKVGARSLIQYYY